MVKVYEAEGESGSKAEVQAVVPERVEQQVRRNLVGPHQGFGPLWYKSCSVRLRNISQTPAEVMQSWKDNFSRFWPQGNYFYEPITGLHTGDVTLIKSEFSGPLELSTGMMVTQSNASSFTLTTAKGHVFAGKISFVAYQSIDGVVAEVRLLARSSDPLIEVAMVAAGHQMENEFWQHTLSELARYFGVRARVYTKTVCLEPNIHWRRFGNLANNPLLRTAFNLIENPGSILGRTRSNQSYR